MENKPSCEDDKCVRCGKCCYYPTSEGFRPCKYLHTDMESMTRCSVYRTRLGRLISTGDSKFCAQVCSLRKNTTHDFKGCPYNTDKPIIF